MADEKDAKLGQLLEAVAKLSSQDREAVSDFLIVLRCNIGNAPTPIENAICEMVRSYASYYESATSPEGAGRWHFTLESLQDKIDDAKDWMDDSISAARHIARLYPYLLNPAEGENAAGAA